MRPQQATVGIFYDSLENKVNANKTLLQSSSPLHFQDVATCKTPIIQIRTRLQLSLGNLPLAITSFSQSKTMGKKQTQPLKFKWKF